MLVKPYASTLHLHDIYINCYILVQSYTGIDSIID